MGDLISYAYMTWRFHLYGETFCEIDGLVFAHLSYFMFEGLFPIDDNMLAIALRDVAQRMDWHHFISGQNGS